MNLYAHAFCYPRTLYEQFFELREFPKYYKSNNPSYVVTDLKDSRVNEETGEQEVLVAVEDYEVKKKNFIKFQSNYFKILRMLPNMKKNG